jgi:hypothetical protein
MDYVYFEQFTTARRDHLVRIGSAVLAIGVVVFCFMNGATVGDLRRHKLTQCTSLAINCEGARADDNTSHYRLGIQFERLLAAMTGAGTWNWLLMKRPVAIVGFQH